MSDNFTSKLVYENIDGRKIRIERSFVYHVGHKGSGEVIRVPSGFVCDGMSYPVQLAICLAIGLGVYAGIFPSVYSIGSVILLVLAIVLGLDIGPFGKAARAGVIHDYLYYTNGREMPENGRCYDRKRSDEIFREALEVSGVNPISRFVRFWMLRSVGGVAWNSHTKRIAKENQ